MMRIDFTWIVEDGDKQSMTIAGDDENAIVLDFANRILGMGISDSEASEGLEAMYAIIESQGIEFDYVMH